MSHYKKLNIKKFYNYNSVNYIYKTVLRQLKGPFQCSIILYVTTKRFSGTNPFLTIQPKLVRNLKLKFRTFIMKNQEENTNINQVSLSKKTWESPEINKWELDGNLKNLPAGAKIDGASSFTS